MMKKIIIKLVFILRILGLAWIPPENIQIGFMGPQFRTNGEVHNDGIQAIAAILMAIREINNKTDGIYDDILPDSQIRFALSKPRADYLEAVDAAVELTKSAFNSTGIVGMVGTASSESSKATAEIFAHSKYKVPQIAYGAESSDLGHKTLYSHFLRTSPSDAYEGRVLARIIKMYFHWHTVTVFSSGDTFGSDTLLEFEDEARKLDIRIESKSSFWSGITDFTDIISAVKSKGGILKVFVLLMKAHDTGMLLEQGYNLGLFKEGTQIFGTQYACTTDTWAVMTPDAPVAKIMKGFIGVIPHLTSTRQLPVARGFEKRYVSQPDTMYIDHGMIKCDDSLDDDGHHYLYQGHADGLLTSRLTCCGMEFSTMSHDGSDIVDLAFYAYDATIALAIGLHKAYYEKQFKNMTGDDLLWTIMDEVDFHGVTGDISFYKGANGFDAFGRGDRTTGIDYQILNFAPRSYHALVNNGEKAWMSEGIWSAENKFEICDMRRDEKCSEWVFNTADNSEPIDEAPILEVQMDEASRVGLRVGGTIALVLVLFFYLVVELCKDTRLIKAAQPLMMKVALIGAMMASIRVLLVTVDLNDVNCVVGKWLGHLAFALAFGALIIKIWRVDAVVNSGFRKVKITMQQVQYILLGGLIVFCIYLAVDTIYSRPHLAYEEYFDGHNTVRLMKCTNDRQDMTIALFTFEALLIAFGARLCWSTKDAPGAVNDARFIAMAMYLILFVCSVTFPIVYLNIHPSPANLLVIMAIAFIVTTIGCALLLFGPKTALLWVGADVNDKFEVVKNEVDGEQAMNGLQHLKNRVKQSVSSGSKKSISHRGQTTQMNKEEDARHMVLNKAVKSSHIKESSSHEVTNKITSTAKSCTVRSPTAMSVGGIMNAFPEEPELQKPMDEKAQEQEKERRSSRTINFIGSMKSHHIPPIPEEISGIRSPLVAEDKKNEISRVGNTEISDEVPNEHNKAFHTSESNSHTNRTRLSSEMLRVPYRGHEESSSEMKPVSYNDKES